MRALPSFGLIALVATGCGSRGLLLMDPPPRSLSVLSAEPARDGATADRQASSRAPRIERAEHALAPPDPVAVPPPPGPAPTAWTALPAPHRAAKATTPTPTPRTPAAARALTGTRDARDPLAYALTVAGGLTGRAHPDLADGAALLTWAGRKGALAAYEAASDAATPPTIEPGDLLVFDGAVGGAPSSLVAVVVGRDHRGVFELSYLAAGVIRRGFVDPARPRVTRDRDRRIVNSFLRHTGDHPPRGTRFRAGELLAARVRLPG